MSATRYFYLDASALAKRYAPELGSPVMDYLFVRATRGRLIILNVGMAEMISILTRKRNDGKIPQPKFVQALIDFRAEITDDPAIRKTVADTVLVTLAFPLITQHSINATDAIMLRSALDLAASLRARGDDIVLVASNGRLLRRGTRRGAERLQSRNANHRRTRSAARLTWLSSHRRPPNQVA